MNREMGLFEALASDGTYNVCVIVRGELAIGRIFAPHTSHEGGTVKGSVVRGRLASTLVIPARSHPPPSRFHAIHCAVERHECPTLGQRAAVKLRSRAAVRQRRRA